KMSAVKRSAPGRAFPRWQLQPAHCWVGGLSIISVGAGFFSLTTVLVALYHVPESRDLEAKPGLDWKGALLVLIGLGSLTYGLIPLPILKWSDPIVLASLSVGLVLLGAFVWVEGHSRAPMLPLTMFRSRAFSVINILTLLLYGALGGTFFFLPFALIQVRG